MVPTLTPIGIAFLVALIVCLAVRPRALVWLLSAAVPFSHTAMVTAGSNGVSPFWVLAVVAAGRLLYLQTRRLIAKGARRTARIRSPRLEGATLALVLFGIYGVLITAIGPGLFAGTHVITPRGGLDSQIGNFAALEYTTSNFAQVCYVVVGIALVLYLITEPPKTPRVIEAAIVTGFALTLFKHFFLQYWPQDWFDSNPSYYYHWIFEGARERGPFAEPSLLGMFVGMSLAYLVSASIRAGVLQRVYYAVLALAGLYIYTISYTGTALLSLGSVALIGAVYVIVNLFRRSTRRSKIVSAAVCALVILLAAIFWDLVSKYTLDLVVEKLGSDSFANRNASNANSLKVMIESWGLGVGLGSDRPSSLFFVLLSSVGIIGTLLFLRAAAGYMLVGLRDSRVQPLVWALIAQLVAQMVAKPDLSMPATWLLLGMLAAEYARWSEERTREDDSDFRTRLRSLVALIPEETGLGRRRHHESASSAA